MRTCSLRIAGKLSFSILLFFVFLFGGCDTGGPDISSGAKIELTGTVKDQSERPVAGVTVSARPEGQYGQTHTTDAAGKFTVSLEKEAPGGTITFSRENMTTKTVKNVIFRPSEWKWLTIVNVGPEAKVESISESIHAGETLELDLSEYFYDDEPSTYSVTVPFVVSNGKLFFTGAMHGIVDGLVHATDTVDPTFFSSIPIEVIVGNRAPRVIGNISNPVTPEDISFEQDLCALIEDDTPLEFSIDTGAEQNSTAIINGCLLSITPGQNYYGVIGPYVVSATDGEYVVELPSFSISVIPVNDRPEVCTFGPHIYFEVGSSFRVPNLDDCFYDVESEDYRAVWSARLLKFFQIDFDPATRELVITPTNNPHRGHSESAELTGKDEEGLIGNISPFSIRSYLDGRHPPIVTDIPNVTFESGQVYVGETLDNYVSDDELPSNRMIWKVEKSSHWDDGIGRIPHENVIVKIDPITKVPTYSAVAGWSGVEFVTFIAEDNDGRTGFDFVEVVVTPVGSGKSSRFH